MSVINKNIGLALADIAAQYPERTGLIHGSGASCRRLTFKEMNSAADAFAHGLAGLGINRGDRVMLMVRPSMEFICLTYALFRIGAIVILIDPGMGYRNLLRCISSARPAVFIGVPLAHCFRIMFPRVFKSVKIKVCVNRGLGIFGKSLASIADFAKGEFPGALCNDKDPAAILFTTGSTGPPKGVCYEHGIFQAQLRLIREYYGISAEDIDQPAFPLFALFSTALGACVVIPDMNPARPARVDPAKFVRTIIDNRVSYSFGSPAIWRVVADYCVRQGIVLDTVKKILMAGAPVPGDLIARVKKIMAADGEIHTPYGATENLPISSISGSEILAETWDRTRAGQGACVGRPLPGIKIRVIECTEAPIADWRDVKLLPVNEIGEIVAQGPVVTRAYDNNEKENRLAKIMDNDRFWHRLGDLGYLDENGRLWFCGRKAHRVVTAEETLYTIPCEAIFNEHPLVCRSALVGVGPEQNKTPVLIVEAGAKVSDKKQLFAELGKLAAGSSLTRNIRHFLLHPAFPVDVRHNAKIFREKLAVWAAEQIREPR